MILTRRQFALSTLASLAPAATKVPVYAHPWVWAAKQPGYDPTPVLDDIFQQLGAAGFDGVELMGHCLLHDDATIDRIAELSRRHHLPVRGSSWSAPMYDATRHAAIEAEARVLLPRLAKLKGTNLGTSVGDAGHRKTEPELDAQAAILRKVISLAAGHGILVNLHNHVYEVANGEWDLNGTLARIPSVKLGPDLGWLFRAKVDPVDFIRRHGSRMVYAHLRNEKADGKWPEDLSEGVINYAAIGDALRQAKFQGALTIELAHERDFVPTRSFGDSFKRSSAYLKQTAGF